MSTMNTITQKQMQALIWEIVRGLVFQFLAGLLQVNDLEDHLDLWDEHTDKINEAILEEATKLTCCVTNVAGARHYARDIYQIAHRQLIMNLWIPATKQHVGADDSVYIWEDCHAHEWTIQEEERKTEEAWQKQQAKTNGHAISN